MPVNNSGPIQIFRTGNHTAMNGASLAFSRSDLEATVNAYNTKHHEAPLVVGHPSTNDPAYGWVKSLFLNNEGVLEATPHQVDTDFVEMVKNGKFKKVSASFYSPNSPGNPTPGIYYLRHVGFLGAQPPAVKGLRSPSFADNERGIVTIAAPNSFEIPKSWNVDQDSLELHQKILAYAEQNGVDYTTAVSAFTEKEPSVPSGYVIDQNQVELHQKILAYAEQNEVDYTTAAMACS
ncbi:MAG: hypothetical protein HQL69_18900 [Magnetococcales bacterium]|nr:hypothetical protein [Magnetococcales bacterium]